jgi:hypothetical protein
MKDVVNMHRLSTASSRRMAAQAAASQATVLTLDPDAAVGPFGTNGRVESKGL